MLWTKTFHLQTWFKVTAHPVLKYTSCKIPCKIWFHNIEANWITTAYLLTAVNRGGALFSSILAPCFSKASTIDTSHLAWSQTWDSDVRPWGRQMVHHSVTTTTGSRVNILPYFLLIWYMYYCWYENFINLIDLVKICDHACLQLKSCHSGNKNQYPSCHCNYAPTKIIHMYITYCYFWIFLKCLKGISCISHLDFLHKLIMLIYESSHHIDKK